MTLGCVVWVRIQEEGGKRVRLIGHPGNIRVKDTDICCISHFHKGDGQINYEVGILVDSIHI